MAQAPTGGSNYKSGYYNIKNPIKYIGNPTDIVFRSSWEYKFMVYCDINDYVVKWGSETFKIPYMDYTGKRRIYIPDFYVEIKNENNPLVNHKFLVEVKPYAETIEPIIPENISVKKLKRLERELNVWQKNKYKWVFAQKWCKDRDIIFKVVTEKNLNTFII